MTRRIIRSSIRLAAVLSSAVALPALAAEGRIPIPFTSPPTTPVIITTPGHYILTRNLAPTGAGNTIEITLPAAGGEVDLDLNGFSVSGNAGASVILATAGGVTSDVRIHDGALQAGAISINVINPMRRLIVERVRAGNAMSAGISATTAVNVVIKDCVITGGAGASNGILLGGGTSQATIEGNLVQSWLAGINVLSPGATVAIVNNRILQTGTSGISLTAIGSLVAENTVRAEGSIGIRLVNAGGCKIFDNVVSRCSTAGILVDTTSSGNLIWKNVIREVVGGPAIFVQGDTNQFEGNVMNINSCGLEFLAGADNNVYRENMARANTGGPAICAAAPCAPNFGNLGAGNSTSGDNFIPTGAVPCN